MAHFAQLDLDNNVINVIVVNNNDIQDLPFPQSEPVGVSFCKSIFGENTIWKQTSYNSTFRKNYAFINGIYDSNLDAFIPVKPYFSWLLNNQTCQWAPPIPYPNDDKKYAWNEATQSWDVVNEN